MSAIYNLFMRNWKNISIDETTMTANIDAAVQKGLLTVEEGEQIKTTPRTES